MPADTLTRPGDVAAAYRAHLERTGLAHATIRSYTGWVDKFTAWLDTEPGHEPVEAFTDPFGRDFAVRDWRAHLSLERRLAPGSVDVSLAALDAFYTWLGLGRAQVRRVGAANSGFGEHLDEAQSKAVLRAAERRGPRDLALVGVMRFAGLRVAEVAALNVDDWWAQERSGEVQVRGKGGKARKVPLSADARRVLLGWEHARRAWPGADGPALFLARGGDRLSARSIGHAVKQVGVAAGVPDLHPHLLRHTFARRLVASGVPLPEVRAYLGHSSLSSTAIYTRPSREEFTAGVERGGESW